MQRLAFKMKLYPGQKEAYRQRHDAIWPELSELLRDSGIYDYSIFLDEETSTLFATYKLRDHHSLEELPQHPVMQRWWHFMHDIMETHPDHSPLSVPLPEVFHMD